MSTEMSWSPRFSEGASVLETERGFKLTIPEGSTPRYRLAQLDDYARLARWNFPHRSLTLSLRARASSNSIPGTWGFGLWNDPFGLSLGFGGNAFRLPALPNAAWFFHASRENYLSFSEKPGNGFMAQVFCSRGGVTPPLILAGLVLPFSRRSTRRLLSRVIEEDGAALSVDVAQWHGYRLDWREKRVLFEVDNVAVLETSVSPRGPLGVVIWIDNQYAAFTPEGKIGFGVLENPEPAWIEIENLELNT